MENQHSYDFCLCYVTLVTARVNMELAEIHFDAMRQFLHCQKSALQGISQNKS